MFIFESGKRCSPFKKGLFRAVIHRITNRSVKKDFIQRTEGRFRVALGSGGGERFPKNTRPAIML
jgi:hypothetical protein